jgi:ureidoacrylate peracid hydrolase
MTATNTALIVMDPQNDLISQQGILYGATEPTLSKNGVITNINRLIDDYRVAGASIIFSPITFSEDYREAGDNPYGVVAAVAGNKAMIRETWGGDIADFLHRETSDPVIERSKIIAFEGTGLEALLREKGITRIVLCGMLSDVCVEGTMRSGYDKGFEVYTATDATAALDYDKHEYTATHNFPLFSKALSTQALCSLVA